MKTTGPLGIAGAAHSLQPIGTIHTPYTRGAPYQPQPDAVGAFSLELDPRYAAGLRGVERFRYLYVLFLADRALPPEMLVRPPWAEGVEVGLFATRSPDRPSPIGLSVVRVLRVEGNVVHTSGLDALDGTPLLDIKPYIAGLDVKPDANLGWVGDLPDQAHLTLHLLGIPHDER
ncbi:MAG: tRNA (N6-threonylcarbamoyladenosine(37)-N6)-methyltransferase TrmO [Deltaproteobacteria bacterium]|nr:tRNA (N6-threonylcarbamoyladenosine(37)-N6)-methyltransferase TrmO [Deltaproteobacteria bacterium]